MVPRAGKMREITCLPVGGAAPYHPWTRAVNGLQHTIPAVESRAVLVPFEHFLVVHGPCPQFVRQGREILEPFSKISFSTIKENLARAVWGEAVGRSSHGRDVLYG